MVTNLKYWTRVLRNLIYVLLLLVGVFVSFKLAVFYMPFLVAFIISLIIEPLIKKMMKKLKLTRKTSSVIIFCFATIIILAVLIWGIITIISEASNLLDELNNYINILYHKINEFLNFFSSKSSKYLPEEMLGVIQGSTDSVINYISDFIRNFLMGLIGIVTSLPSIGVCISITILALYFICVDKIYILDQIEHHVPAIWVKKFGRHLKELIGSLGGYLKAEATLILVSFVISLIGLYALDCMGFNIEFPLLMALFIGFVDALPILGSGTVMIPWAIISGLNGDLNLGIALIVLLIIMSLARQFLEPKLVSKHIGIHPIFTLIAMYTGFKVSGIWGLILGPIILIVLKNVLATFIDKGIIKTIFERK